MRMNLIAIALLLLLGPVVNGQTYTWIGAGVNDNWNNSVNWSGGTFPVSGASTTLQFSQVGGSNNPSIQNLANPFVVNTLQFTAGAGGHNISGSPIEFRPNGIAAPRLRNLSANVQTISAPLQTTASLIVSGSGEIRLSGGLTGGPLLVQLGGGEVRLSSGTYSHQPVMDSGILEVWNGVSLPGVTVRGDSRFEAWDTVAFGNAQLVRANNFGQTGRPTLAGVTGPGSTRRLLLTGDVLYDTGAGGFIAGTDALIDGTHLDLGTVTRTFTVGSNGTSTAMTIDTVVESATAGVGLTKTGPGILALAGPAFYSGPTTIQQGEFRLTGDGRLSSSSFVVLEGAARLRFSNALAQQATGLSGTSGTSTLSLGDSPLTIGADGLTAGYAGLIEGSATSRIVKIGTGTQMLSGNSTSFLGAVEVQRGVLAVTYNTALGGTTNPTKVIAGGTLRADGSFAHSRTLDLTAGGAVAVAAGQTLTHQNANILGGFLRGPCTHALALNTFVAGTTILSDAVVNHPILSNVQFQNVNSSGTHTFTGSAAALTWDGGQLSAAGRITMGNSHTLNTTVFESIGTIQVNPGATWNHSGGPLTLGGGSVTNVGVYNPANGQVTLGGTINLGSNNIVVRGGLLRNNGTITTTGNLVVDFGGVARGAGDYDTGGTQLINGGQFLAGNSPGLVRNSNLTVTGPSTVGGDFTNATGTVGGFAAAANGNTTNSGWSAIEFGNSVNTASGLTIQRTAGGPAIWRFRTTLNDTIGDTPGAPANFDPNQSYSWLILRPRTNASATTPTPTLPSDQINTVATITLLDQNGNILPNTNANLNSVFTFDRSLFINPATGAPITSAVGSFQFVFGPDLIGRENTTISLQYVPVPEPGLLIAGCALLGLAAAKRRRK